MESFKSHILVIDDDEGIRSLLKQFLNENGYLVNTASNALEAKEKISIIKFDLLVLDIMMPGNCLLYTSPSPRDISGSRMPSSA